MYTHTLADVIAESKADDADVGDVVEKLVSSAIKIAGSIRLDGTNSQADSVLKLGDALPSINSAGDTQKALDVLADTRISDDLKNSSVAWLLSEEQDEPIQCNPQGTVIVAVDPLDGSSNLGVNGVVGTIFSILPKGEILQPGRNQLAAGFFTYGPQVTLLLAFKDTGCFSFVLDPAQNQFVLVDKNIAIPETSNEYAINSAYARHWLPPVQQWMENVIAGSHGDYAQDYTMRWAGSLVADAWRIFQRGGVFLYPADRRENHAHGRLRLIYEASPMAFLAERAGGLASDGVRPILDITPESLHQRTPLIFGSKQEVERVQKLHQNMPS